MAAFPHLHVHSCFSFHDGADTPEALVERAAALGCAALALTDTNGLYGAVPFCKAAAAAGIAPLLGAVLDGGDPDGPCAVVLARGRAGYPALCRIVTRRHLGLVGANPAPTADFGTCLGDGSAPDQRRGGAKEWPSARQHAGPPDISCGLVELLAAETGNVVVLVAAPALLRALAPRLPAGTLFGELVYDGTAASTSRCRATLAACRALGLPFAATNAVRFAAAAGFETHRVLRAIGENGTVWSTKPRAHPQHFLKSPAEMRALFAHLPAALEAAARIAEECACAIGFDGWKFPEAHVPPGETAYSVLWQKSFEGLRQRYRPLTREAVERLRSEIGVIDAKGFAPYFLAVDEIASTARSWGLRMVGRGSAANSLVSYCLGLTHVDPLAHGLFFERFLNPERSSPPDIDLDFSWKDRDRLLAWVYERWGADRVAMISTHVTFGPRAAVRETGKAHGLPDDELTRLTRRIPHWGVHGLTGLAATVPECRGLPDDDPTFARVLSLGERVIGHPRHLSIHAGGIVIAPGPLTDLVPLERAAKGFVVTQYDMGPVEALGLIKIDLLSQRSLGVLQDAAAAVAAHTGTPPPVDDRERILADPGTRRLIRTGSTMGCFYVESPAMRSLLKKLRTETFEELTAASSVIRPGVAESGMMQEYIRRHHIAGSRGDRTSQATCTTGIDESWYPDPRLEAVLRETHGVMIYQEDVLRVAHALAGMSLAEADLLRRSMSGKLRSPEAMARVRESFRCGCGANGVAPAVAEETWRQIESFAGYAFCKAHSASYAVLSFQVAYLKAHHPAEFMAAVVSNQGGFYATAAYLSEARRMGLRILLPDVNRSERDYTGRGREIRMGLMAFEGLAESAIDGLLAARREGGPFTNLTDLLARSGLGRADLELFVRGGACDGFELTRPELLWRLACRSGAGNPPHHPLPKGGKTGNPAEGGRETDLFPGAGGLDHLVPRLPEYGLVERCRMEEEIFGFPVTRHPLELLPERTAAPRTPPLPEGPPLITAAEMHRFSGRRVRMRGLAISYKRVPTKAGTWMKFLSLEDLTGTFEAVLFPEAYARYAEATLGTGPFLLEGRVEVDHAAAALTVERLSAPGGTAAAPGRPRAEPGRRPAEDGV